MIVKLLVLWFCQLSVELKYNFLLADLILLGLQLTVNRNYVSYQSKDDTLPFDVWFWICYYKLEVNEIQIVNPWNEHESESLANELGSGSEEESQENKPPSNYRNFWIIIFHIWHLTFHFLLFCLIVVDQITVPWKVKPKSSSRTTFFC